MSLLTHNPAWPLLTAHADEMKAVHLHELFARDSGRFRLFHLRHEGLLLDFSRQRITVKTRELLLQGIDAQGFAAQRAALFAGDAVNATEGRAALHMALRAPEDAPFMAGGKKIMADVARERERALSFADAIRAGRVTGATGEKITGIIHVGIGGSDLGPRLLAEAFADGQSPAVHFIGNVDAGPIEAVMKACDPRATLLLVASKTFTTAETMQNVKTLQAWLAAALGDKAAQHLVALTATPETAKKYGIGDDRIFRFWDWVGGRYSICSVISLPAMIVMGRKNFMAFLAGAHAMDGHFKTAPLSENMPVLLAALDIWNVNLLGARARAVIPYAEKLAAFPAYLQQLEMESLGKQVSRSGQEIDYVTTAAVFGASGTPAQHAFMQALHQGNNLIPADILCVKKPASAHPAHDAMLLANALAQVEALAFGTEPGDALPPHQRFAGNRPSSLFMLDELSPYALGQLVALFEHKVFAASVFLDINPFDQWGVELGKKLAGPIFSGLTGAVALPASLKSLMAS